MAKKKDFGNTFEQTFETGITKDPTTYNEPVIQQPEEKIIIEEPETIKNTTEQLPEKQQTQPKETKNKREGKSPKKSQPLPSTYNSIKKIRNGTAPEGKNGRISIVVSPENIEHLMRVQKELRYNPTTYLGILLDHDREEYEKKKPKI